MNMYGYKCKKCGHLHYPYRMVCPNCRKNEYNEFEPVPLPKEGKLLTFTHLYTVPEDFEVAILNLGIVELDNGIRMTGQLNIPKPQIGMRVQGKVEVVRSDDYNKFYGIVFYEA
jgi:uncharacterized OB-fold protein